MDRQRDSLPAAPLKSPPTYMNSHSIPRLGFALPRPARLFLPLVILVGSLGCASRNEAPYQSYLGRARVGSPSAAQAAPRIPAAFDPSSHFSVREIHLSHQQPVDDTTRIELLSVANDQTTRIRTGRGEILTGRPGDYFASPGLGASGLQLVTASSEAGDALFEQRLRR